MIISIHDLLGWGNAFMGLLYLAVGDSGFAVPHFGCAAFLFYINPLRTRS